MPIELKIDSDFVRSSLAFTVLKEHVKYAESSMRSVQYNDGASLIECHRNTQERVTVRLVVGFICY